MAEPLPPLPAHRLVAGYPPNDFTFLARVGKERAERALRRRQRLQIELAHAAAAGVSRARYRGWLAAGYAIDEALERFDAGASYEEVMGG